MPESNYDLSKLSPEDRAMLRQSRNGIEYELALRYMESIGKFENDSKSNDKSSNTSSRKSGKQKK